MSTFCVNISDPEFKELHKHAQHLDTKTFAAIVGDWMSKNNNKYPSINDIKDIIPTASTREKITLVREFESTLPNKDAKFTKDVMDLMDVLFMNFLFGPTNVDKIHDLHDAQTSAKVFNDIYNQIYEFLNTRATDENRVYVLDHYAEIVKRHGEKLTEYNLAVDFDKFQENQTEKYSNETTKLFADAALELNAKVNSSKSTKLILSSIVDEDSINETFGLPKLVDFGRTFNKLINVLSNTTSITDKLMLLNQYANQDRAFEYIKKRLNLDKLESNTISHSQFMSVLQFNQTFSKHFYEYNILLFDGAGGFNSIDANANSLNKRVLTKWGSNVDRNGKQYTLRTNDVVYNQKYFKDTYTSGQALMTKNKLHNSTLTFPSRIKPNTKRELYSDIEYNELITAYRNEYDKPLREFLSDIGIEFSHNLEITKGIGDAKAEDVSSRMSGLLDNIILGKTKFLFSRKYSDDGSARELLIQHETLNSIDIVENSHYANGVTKYNATLNSYITLVIDKFNNALTKEEFLKEFPHLAIGMNNSIFMSNKYWKNGQRTKEQLVLTIEETLKANDSETEFDNSTEEDKFVWEFSRIINDGVYSFLRAGDNSVERTLNLGTIAEDPNYTKFVGYIQDEIELVKTIIANPTQYNNAIRLINDAASYSMFSDFLNNSARTQFNKAAKGESYNISIIQQSLKQGMDNWLNTQSEVLFDYMVDSNMIVSSTENTYELIAIPQKSQGETSTNILNKQSIVNTNKRYLLNRFYGNIEQVKFFTGHPVFYKNPDDFFKRMSALVGTKNISNVDHLASVNIDRLFTNPNRLYKSETGDYSDVAQPGYVPIIKLAVSADVKVGSKIHEYLKKHVSAETYRDIAKTDAIGLISMNEYRDMQIRNSEWSKADEALYQLEELENTTFLWDNTVVEITKDTLKNPDGTNVTFNMLKPQYFGPLHEEGFVPSMNKLSVLPVRKAYSIYPEMKKILDYMSENNVGVVTFESATKIGTKLNPNGKMNTIVDKNGVIDFTGFVTQDTYYKYWGIQLNTGKTQKYEVASGTQFMKHIFGGLYDKGKPINSKAVELGDSMQSVFDRRIQYGVSQLKKRLGLKEVDGEYTIDNIDKFIDTLTSAAKDRNADLNILNTIAQLKDKATIDRFGLDIIVNRDMLENIMMSIVDKEVFSRKMYGGAKVQSPSLGFESIRVEKINGKDVYVSDDLKFYEDGVMEVYLPHWFNKDVDIENVDSSLLEALGFRIPTSGLNSIERIRIKGFLPQSAGETIILPSEIVEKAGSDFDVDKLNVFLKHYLEMPDGRFVVDSVENRYNKYIQNKQKEFDIVVENVKADEERINEELGEAGQELAKGLSLETDVVETAKELRPDLLKLPTLEEFTTNEEYAQYRGNEINFIENELIDVANQILMLETNQSALFKPIGVDMFAKVRDEINALKGIERKPTFSTILYDAVDGLNIRQRNIESKRGTGVAALQITDHIHAVRYGFALKAKNVQLPGFRTELGNMDISRFYNLKGVSISDILNQFVNMFVDGAKDPLALDLNFTLDNANTIALMIRNGIPLETVAYTLSQPSIIEYTRLKSVNKSIYTPTKSLRSLRESLMVKYGDASQTRVTDTLLKKELVKPSDGFQRFILEEFIKVEEYAQEYSNYIQASRIDTEGTGKNTTELDYKLVLINQLMSTDFVTNWSNLFTDGGYLKTRFDALKDIDKMMHPLYMYKKNPSVQTNYRTLIDYLTNRTGSFEDKAKVLERFKRSVLSMQFMKQPFLLNGKEVHLRKEIPRLMFGEGDPRGSMAKRIIRFKESNEKNLLVDLLHPIIHQEPITPNGLFIDNIKLFEQRLEKTEANQLIDAWRELFFKHPEFAEDLVKTIIAQSGFQTGPMNFTRLIPFEYFFEMFSSMPNFTMTGQDYIDFLLHTVDSKMIAPDMYWDDRYQQYSIPSGAYFGKRFAYVEEIQKAKTKNERNALISAYKEQGIPIKYPQPVLKASPELNLNVVGEFVSPVPRDFRASKELTMYGILDKLESVPQQKIETTETIVEETDPINEVIDFYKRCFPNTKKLGI